MGVNRFILILFFFAVGFVFYDIQSIDDDIQKEEKPLVSFYNSTAYSLDEEGVSSIIKSSEAYMYKKREEMVDATMLSGDKKGNVSNFLQADFVTKIEENYYFDGNVFFQSKNGLILTSEQLEYNALQKIIQNDLPFKVEHNGNIYHGEDLFYDSFNDHLNAKKVKFLLKENNG